MSADGLSETRGGFWSSLAALFASTGTLVCCALPAVLVALGAGAALSSLVAVFPQIVWLRITVRKPSAPVPGILDYAQVSVEHRA